MELMSPGSSVLGSPELTSELETILHTDSSSERQNKSSKLGSEEGDIDDYNTDTDSSPLTGSLNIEEYDPSDEDQASLYISDEEHGADSDLDSDLDSDPDSTSSQEGAAQGSNTLHLDNSLLHKPKFDALPISGTQDLTPSEQLYKKILRDFATEFVKNITISDDQSAGSKIEERNLLVLRDRANRAPGPYFIQAPLTGGKHASQDYQMQLMLLEQQNKKRLLMARQEQDSMEARQQQGMIITRPHSAENDSAENGAEIATLGPSQAVRTTDQLNRLDDQEMETNLQGVLDGADASQLDLQKLQEYIELLQVKARQYETIQKEQAPFRWQIIYRIKQTQIVHDRKGPKKVEKCLSFFDRPEWVRGQGDTSRLQCNLPLENFDLYLEKNKDITFIVYRNFDINETGVLAQPQTGDVSSERAAYLPQHSSETIRPVDLNLIEAIKNLLGSRQEYSQILSIFSESYELAAPYLFIYHERKSLEEFQNSLPLPAKAQLSLLSKFIAEEYADEYTAADSLLSQDKTSPAYIRYLFKPGDLLVSRVDGQYMGHVATSWPKITWEKKVPRMRAAISNNGTGLSPYGSQDAEARMATDKVTIHVCRINAWHWAFDGSFQRKHETFDLEISSIEDGKTATNIKGKNVVATQVKEHKPTLEGKSISDLNVFPMQFASAEIIDKCRRRGKTFWKCRTRNYVSYQDSELESIQNLVDERYMVDLKTHRSLHPENTYGQTPLADELGPEAMARDEPPDEQFELLLPLKIKGYNLRRKKWFDLMADRISDVTWNKEAFQNLVIDRKARDLIRALVSNQLAAEKGTDLIMGKGNGLILLLHGGPGTGKTLTAESVAEIAEKPLYRVTCGDIGTKAEDVEKYLESVLHLGKIWGCVVLLDEADVFLEQRSLEDMQRNALVSVFLRVLEYYEGILVLTSNRVGTFDEAFRSRIQLALHYPVLGPYQRLRIWENFLNRLESFGDDDKVDIADLRDHLEDLKEEKMNGRQIRNAITTARQYAEWKGKKLTYEHLSDVIEVSGRFDQYLDRLNGGFTQDQFAEDEGLRLA